MIKDAAEKGYKKAAVKVHDKKDELDKLKNDFLNAFGDTQKSDDFRKKLENVDPGFGFSPSTQSKSTPFQIDPRTGNAQPPSTQRDFLFGVNYGLAVRLRPDQ